MVSLEMETLTQCTVYHVDPASDHDDCMEAFSQAGIYLFLDMDTFNTQIEQEDPHWNATQYTDFTDVIDVFYKYDNLAGFFFANEVSLLHLCFPTIIPFIFTICRHTFCSCADLYYR